MNDRRLCTVAFARRTADGWELAGGGVCVQVNQHAIAFSAGHLLHAGDGALWLGADGATVRVRGAMTRGQEPYAPPEIRRLDMGFVPLLSDDRRRLPALEFISPLAVDLEDEPTADAFVVIAPADPAGVDRRVSAAAAAPHEAYAACGVDVATHVVVDLPDAADATGLLGSGVWRQTPGPSGDLFVGVVVDVRPLSRTAGLRLVATRAGIVLYSVLGVLGIAPGLPKARRKARGPTVKTH